MKNSSVTTKCSPQVLLIKRDLEAASPTLRWEHQGIKITVAPGLAGCMFHLSLNKSLSVTQLLAPSWGLPVTLEETSIAGDVHTLQLRTDAGVFSIKLQLVSTEVVMIRSTVEFTPSRDLIIRYWPRDLYIHDQDLDVPSGTVLAAQRGLNSGVVFLTTGKEFNSTLLYFQDFTSLADYFAATDTKPDTVVGGDWPELGYSAPVSDSKPLKADRSYVVSDAYLGLDRCSCEQRSDAFECAGVFLDLLANIYRCLQKPPTTYRSWPDRAKKTLRDFNRSPSLSTEAYGHKYVRPYVDAEYPDSMVQLAVIEPVRVYERWVGKAVPLADQLQAGLGKFFDESKKTLRRYLPNVGADKDPDEVDSWYLYHPLSNLGRLALAGDEEALDLFCRSLDFGINVARHFQYRWPIQFKVSTLEIIKKDRKPGEPGQSDVGGIYAYVMMQAYQLTKEMVYLEEAKLALKALRNYRFELLYQSNLTSIGATACAQVWKATGDSKYLDQSYVFLANLLHNCAFWKSELGFAKDYQTFSGVACLHDGPYMALYECYETFRSLYEYLSLAYDIVPESIRLLVGEHLKYGPDRAWFFYPSELPEGAISEEVRNGRISRELSIPVEDLYMDGRPAGSVGQEVYGCGAPFVFAAHNYHRIAKGGLRFYCEYPIDDLRENEDGFSCRVLGGAGMTCRARLIPSSPKTNLAIEGLAATLTPEGHWELVLEVGEVQVRIHRAKVANKRTMTTKVKKR